MNKKNITYIRLFSIIALFAMCILSAGEASRAHTDTFYSLTAREIMLYADSIEGKKVLFIYATWCPHCRNAMPDVIKLAQEKPGSIIPISVDEKKSKVLNYLSRFQNLPFPMIWYNPKGGAYIEDYLKTTRRRGVPHFILINEDGSIAASQNMYMEDVRDFVTND